MPNDITGTIQIKNGKYFAVLNLRHPDGSRKQKWVTTGLEIRNNKRAAEKRLREIIAEYEERNQLFDSDMLFWKLMEEWLESIRLRVRDSTYHNYKLVAEAHIIPYFKDLNIKAKDLLPRDLEKYYAEMLKTLSPVTVQKHHANIHSALEYGRKNRIVPTNVAKDVQLKKASRKQKGSFYTTEQIKTLLEAAQGDPIEVPIMLIAQFGMRRSEALGLKWSDIDFANHLLTIHATVVYHTAWRGPEMREKLKNLLLTGYASVGAAGKWLGVAVLTGVLCGAVGTLFHVGVERVTELRAAHGWLLYLLPLAGLAIGAIYKVFGTSGVSTDNIIEEVHSGRGVSLALLPTVFFATLLTHLGGGSVGREGAALQMGGTIGYQTARLLRLDDSDTRTATSVGMSAFFSALFGTPLAATVFALEITNVGRVYYVQFFPCLAASLSAYGVSLLLGVEPTAFTVAAPELALGMLLRVGVLAVLCAFVSVLFCETIHAAGHLAEKFFPNEWLRVVVGGCVIVALTVLLGTTDYNGAGMGVIARAVERGQASPAAFALKLLFTAVTLSAGFKGGEVVPSFFVGATFGCVVGPLLGVPATFAAALGLTAVFCGAVNCPLASTFLALELFGAEGMLYFALACALSFALSGYSGIYSSQRILYDKLKAKYINVRTNSHSGGGA